MYACSHSVCRVMGVNHSFSLAIPSHQESWEYEEHGIFQLSVYLEHRVSTNCRVQGPWECALRELVLEETLNTSICSLQEVLVEFLPCTRLTAGNQKRPDR